MTNQYRTAKEAKGLKQGDLAPMFEATDLHGEPYKLAEALKAGPVVIIFYRGQWCPFCNMHLKALEKKLFHIYDKGASVVAVSPEKSEFLARTAEKTGASFRLLHDENYRISDAFDLTFRPNAAHRLMYNTILGANLEQAHSDDSQQLPIPATYIVSTDGVIVWRHFNPDYKKRSSIKDILKNIP